MKLDLSNKIAVVSGSTSGIGLGIAKGLAQAGATVVNLLFLNDGTRKRGLTCIAHYLHTTL
ncbi:3-hydroxybutyrate dehydrogenase [Yersinia frederiksenii]|nr:3-hydroxybutyrate dehydrogenase [Yersinia frederiksenii]